MCRAVETRSTDVTESHNFLSSRCSPFASHTSTEQDFASGSVAANVLLASSGSATILARMNGFAVWTHRVPMAFNPDLSR